MNTWPVNTETFVWARSDDPKCLEWESLGYTLAGESWGAHLDLSKESDYSKYAGKIKKVKIAGIDIREIRIAEISLVIELEENNFKDYPITPATTHTVATPEKLNELININGAIFGAFIDNALIGVLATKKYPEKVEIEFASIAPEYRGKSIASGLGSFAILHYLSKGMTTFATGGAAVNSSSKGSVESLGFVIDEFWRSYKVPS